MCRAWGACPGMKLLITILLALIGSVALALYIMEDPGYVLIAYRDYTLESTLSFSVLLLLLAFMLLYGLIRFGSEVWGLPARMQSWNHQRQKRRAQRNLYQGLMELAQGHWKQAERVLTRQAGSSEVPLLNYLAAARAAQHQHARERRDHYLLMAFNSAPSASLAIGLTQAELQFAGGQLEQALATLTNIKGDKGRHDYVLGLLVQIYRRLRDWGQLRALLPEVRRQKVLAEDELRELEIEIFTHLMERAGVEQDLHELHSLWKDIPRTLHEECRLLCAYVRHLIGLGANDEAESLARNALRRGWSDELVAMYGMIESSNPAKQLSRAEAWLKERGKDAALHLALARISMRNRLWGKARIYYETSLHERASIEAYGELAALLEQLNDNDAAMECYRKGILLATGH